METGKSVRRFLSVIQLKEILSLIDRRDNLADIVERPGTKPLTLERKKLKHSEENF